MAVKPPKLPRRGLPSITRMQRDVYLRNRNRGGVSASGSSSGAILLILDL